MNRQSNNKKDDHIIAANQLRGRKNTFEAMAEDLRKELDKLKKILNKELRYV